MDINERILNISKYFITMQVEPSEDTQLIRVDLNWPEKWFFAEDTLDKFQVSVYQENKMSHAMFFCDILVGFDAVFDAIDYNIKLNLDAQRKTEIYQEKVKELKEIFLNENYTIEQLEKLSFLVGEVGLDNTETEELLPVKRGKTVKENKVAE